ncbi:hypothetical protein OSG_eHP29_00165 [environmental Halophage eHP-29]|nr:hypothetical protein OSG_eHP29_00165 [environmental Halophage eHP-29]
MSSLSDDEIEQHKEKLKQDTEKARQKEQEKRQSLLDSVEQDSQIGNTNTVQFGEIEIDIRHSFPANNCKRYSLSTEGMLKPMMMRLSYFVQSLKAYTTNRQTKPTVMQRQSKGFGVPSSRNMEPTLTLSSWTGFSPR